jgi:hypothetical protein
MLLLIGILAGFALGWVTCCVTIAVRRQRRAYHERIERRLRE